MPTGLHHVSLGTNDLEKALAFYDPVLAAIGLKRVVDALPYAIGYGVDRPIFWVGPPHDQQAATIGNGVHLGFHGPTKEAIDAFHAAALKHGGSDDGKPGPRAAYGPDYYGAFVRDPEGNKIEACINS